MGNIKKDPKSFFAYTRSKTRTKDSVGPFVDNEGYVITDTSETAKVLNDFFISVFTDEDVECLPELAIASSLSEIFTDSMAKGEIPEDWECANVTPLYKKKGSKSQPGNYRPVSLKEQATQQLKTLLDSLK